VLKRLRTIVVGGVAALAVTMSPNAASHAAVRFQSPYPCAYCLFEVPLDAGTMRVVWADPPVSSIDDLSPVRGQLVFSRGERSGSGLYVSGLDGSGARRVATGDRGRWSPDGAAIAYRRPLPFPCAGTALWIVTADGGNEHPASTACSLHPAWSPDSRRLALFVVSGLNADIGTLTIADADGGSARALTTVQSPRAVAWSPRGDRLAYAALPDAQPPSGHGVSAGGPHDLPTPVVALVRVDGARLALLSRADRPVWTPSGDGFAFSHSDVARTRGYESTEYRQSLRLASADGGAVRRLRERCCGLVRWLGDGRLAYLADGPSPKRGTDTTQIFVARRDGSEPKQVTHLLPGGTIDGYWFAPDEASVYLLWEFTDVD
jgi:Tol biopolymer transport system component